MYHVITTVIGIPSLERSLYILKTNIKIILSCPICLNTNIDLLNTEQSSVFSF